jgi:ribosomal protein L11 methyltransferase
MEIKDTYIEIRVAADAQMQDIIIAELSELGFDNFVQEDDAIAAYTFRDNYEKEKKNVEDILRKYEMAVISINDIKNDINWNSKWEEYFEPVQIGNEVYIRAIFHEPKPEFTHEIIIQPKMSFGTGHHETTQLMMELMLQVEFRNTACLDMGTGTGVLSILASQLGASFIAAVDYDEWCILNAAENFGLNNIANVSLAKGDSSFLSDHEFLKSWNFYESHIITSNITKNYNLENLQAYSNICRAGDVILLSGFYETDLQDLQEKALNCGLKYVKSKVKNKWCAVQFQR